MLRKLLVAIALLVCFSQSGFAQCTATLALYTSSQICSGDSIFLQASPTNSTYTFTWYDNGNVIATNNNSTLLAIPGTSGSHNYYVIINNNSGCTATSNTQSVTVATSPAATASSNSPVCVGSAIQLTGTAAGGASHTWYGPMSYTSTQLSPTISNAQISNMGTYYFVASAGGCTTTIPVQVVANNSVMAYETGDTAVCLGNTIHLYGATNMTGTISYSWTGPNGFTSSQQNPTITNAQAVNTGNYILTVNAGTGCLGQATMMVTVGTQTAITFASSTNPTCVNGGTISVSGLTPQAYYTFHATLNGTPIASQYLPADSAGGVTAHNLAAGTYTNIYITNAITCGSNVIGPIVLATTQSGASVSLHTITPICMGTTMQISATLSGITSPVYSWSGPNGYSSTASAANIPNVSTAATGIYTLSVTGTTCLGQQTVSNTISSLVVVCTDSVWPGDANNDLIVNYQDVLQIGVGNLLTGPARPNASTTWIGQYCPAWSTSTGPVNSKFADCNGDGVIDSSDVISISQHYTLTHLRGQHEQGAKTTGFPDLYFDMTGITMTPGATVSVPIKLGTSAIPMQHTYGVAAEAHISGISPGNMTLTTPAGWMGNNNNSLNYTRHISNSQTDWAYTRFDHHQAGGQGTIGMLTFTVPMNSQGQQVTLYLNNVKIVDSSGLELTDYNIIDGIGMVVPVGVASITNNVQTAIVFPNPSSETAELRLTLLAPSTVDVVIADLSGRKVWQHSEDVKSGVHTIQLPHNIAPGIYTIRVKDATSSLPVTIKWMKQ